ncbi:hypothetical protein [Micromonospora sp. WMMD812]|uniref:hypothetical protein n=1 Tax=Micromonospora sp. WMMD812 TaxID=3015152 RepID=UPI00248BD567|nr:hypothetical protein [Micromonospora sp. WMMD812]WBB70761.1 hypothetical protein O7603_15980 [Micromonospora sp. WMMD812]
MRKPLPHFGSAGGFSPFFSAWFELALGLTKIWKLPGGSSHSAPPYGAVSPV